MKHRVITAIKILVSTIMLGLLVHASKLNFSLLIDLLYSPGLLLGTICLYFVGIAISAWRWQQLNKAQNISLSYRHTVTPTYLGIALNNLLPGGVGGDFFRFYFLKKKIAVKKSSVMMSILFDRITGLMGIFIAVCLVSMIYLQSSSRQKLMLYFIIFSLILCFAFGVLYFLSALLPKKLGLSAWLNDKFTDKKWLNAILSFLEALSIYRNSKKILIECLLASVIVQALIAVICMLIAQMMHFHTFSFSDYIIAIAVTQLVNLIPIAPGGIGVGEVAFANVLTLLNPSLSGTYATIFLAYRIIGIVVYLPGIIVFILNFQAIKQKKSLQELQATRYLF